MIARLGRQLENLPAGTLPRWLLRTTLALAAVVVVLDFLGIGRPPERLVQRAAPPQEPTITLERPREGDQRRTFDRRRVPQAPDGAEPILPTGTPLGIHPPEQRMTFEFLGPRNRLPAFILAAGSIEIGSASELERFDLKHDKRAAGVILFSPGGHVLEALALGRYIRKRGLATLVPDEHLCASSCPLVFAAGVKRIAGNKAWLGVHQMYVNEPLKPGTSVRAEIADIQDLTSTLLSALQDWGVEPSVWIPALSTPPSKIYYYTAQELTAGRIATHIASDQRELQRALR
jgi:hypothetical protein